jgi:hypothetical protein
MPVRPEATITAIARGAEKNATTMQLNMIRLVTKSSAFRVDEPIRDAEIHAAAQAMIAQTAEEFLMLPSIRGIACTCLTCDFHAW